MQILKHVTIIVCRATPFPGVSVTFSHGVSAPKPGALPFMLTHLLFALQLDRVLNHSHLLPVKVRKSH
jgi:hypothetical protein